MVSQPRRSLSPRLGLRLLDYAWILGRQLEATARRRVPERWSQGSLRPVLLLPGVWEPWPVLGALADRLNTAGHPVHVVPGLGYNDRSIPRTAADVVRYLELTDLREVVLLAHSKGGLIGKWILLSAAGHRIERLIAISTPFGGSRYASFMLTPSLREFRPNAPTIASMAPHHEANARIVSIFGSFDPHIPEGSRLPGAENIEVDVGGHFRVLGDAQVAHLVESRARG